MRTTLDLPDPLFKELKTRAVQQGLKLKDLLARYVEAGLHDPSLQANAAPSLGKRPPLPVAISRVEGTPLTPALSNAGLYAIMDEEDTSEYRRVLKRQRSKS